MYLSLLYDDDLVEYQTSQEWNLNFQGKTLFSIFFYLKRKRVQRLFKDALIISIGQDLVKQFWI